MNLNAVGVRARVGGEVYLWGVARGMVDVARGVWRVAWGMVGLPLGMLVGMVWRDWSLGAVLYG